MRWRFVLPALLVVIGIVLVATTVPGIFIIDDDNYIATIAGLRDGSFRVPSTAGLPPSPELFSFDAAAWNRVATETPLSPNSPPLYAFFALPFSYFGLRGLIALQTIAFLVCAWLVFRVVRRETERVDLAWFALGTFLVGSYAIDYAQAVWPHALTMALVAGAIEMISVLRKEHPPRRAVLLAVIAGLCLASAAGIRYQNIALVGTAAAALLWVPRRRLAIAGYALGCAIPLFASASINASRLGTWNPISKGGGYLRVERGRTKAETVEQLFVSTWARVVDLSAWKSPPPETAKFGHIQQSNSGVYQVLTGFKKSLLQSAPWAAVSLLALLLAWFRRRAEPPSRNLLRGFSIMVVGLLGAFGLYGFRDDGWCFNQRYLLELMPLLCVTLGIALVDWKPSWRALAIGVVAGIVLGGVIVWQRESFGAQFLMMKLPVFIAVVAAIAWSVRERFKRTAIIFTTTLGIALGWSAALHLASDMPSSRLLRKYNELRLASFTTAVPDDGKPIALYVYWGNKDAFGPLMLERDIVIVDPWIDNGKDAVMLLDALLRQGRIVYIDRAMPPEILQAITTGRRVQGGKLPWLIRIAP